MLYSQGNPEQGLNIESTLMFSILTSTNILNTCQVYTINTISTVKHHFKHININISNFGILVKYFNFEDGHGIMLNFMV